jgi:hypothetical protein
VVIFTGGAYVFLKRRLPQHNNVTYAILMGSSILPAKVTVGDAPTLRGAQPPGAPPRSRMPQSTPSAAALGMVPASSGDRRTGRGL